MLGAVLLLCGVFCVSLAHQYPRSECRYTNLGFEYSGTVNRTVSGRTCQAWVDQTPHKHSYADSSNYPDCNAEMARNYCRNPSKSDVGLWCYTTDPEVRWERCDIPDCYPPHPCRVTVLGTEYRGRLNVTMSGRSCQKWIDQSPHNHKFVDSADYPEDSIVDAVNFCRNPSRSVVGPWCYTQSSGKRWEVCDVPLCQPEANECKTSELGAEYTGTQSVTASGRTCQQWTSQSPHKHRFTFDAAFPNDESLQAVSNYCRNPDNEASGPWCYTTVPTVRWESCGIPDC